jgi:hypothetical protein
MNNSSKWQNTPVYTFTNVEGANIKRHESLCDLDDTLMIVSFIEINLHFELPVYQKFIFLFRCLAS